MLVLGVQGLCLNTTSAAVRVAAFQALVRLVPRLDQAEGVGMLAATAQASSGRTALLAVPCLLAVSYQSTTAGA